MTVDYYNVVEKIAKIYELSGGYALLWKRFDPLKEDLNEFHFKIVYDTVDKFLQNNRVFGFFDIQIKRLAEECRKLENKLLEEKKILFEDFIFLRLIL